MNQSRSNVARMKEVLKSWQGWAVTIVATYEVSVTIGSVSDTLVWLEEPCYEEMKETVVNIDSISSVTRRK